MIRREVKKIVVHYENGEIKELEGDQMYHIARNDFHRGSQKPDQFISHDIRWKEETE